MSALGRLPPQEQERLSAYADGALSPREQASLETRLEKEGNLRLALEELRGVKAALAGLPEQRVPRNFTLRDAEVPRRASRPRYIYLRFATVLATGLFVVTAAVRSVSWPLPLGAAAPQVLQQDELQAYRNAAVAGTAEAGAMSPITAPAAAGAPQGPTSEALAPAPTPTAAGTACPECPTSLTTEKAEVGAEVEAPHETAATVPPPVSALAVVEWSLGLAAVVLGVLTLRARRG